MRRFHTASLASLLGITSTHRGPCHARFGSQRIVGDAALATIEARVTGAEGNISNLTGSVDDLQTIAIDGAGVPIRLDQTTSTGTGSDVHSNLTIAGPAATTGANYVIRGRAIVRRTSDGAVMMNRTFLGTEVTRGSSSWTLVAKGNHVDSDVHADIADFFASVDDDGPELGDNGNALCVDHKGVTDAEYGVEFDGVIARSKPAA